MARVSCDKDSVHYQPPSVTREWEITCNGEPLQKVREFDTDEGWAVCFAVNEMGQMYVDPDNPGQAKTVRHEGVIDVRKKQEA